jgi:hypothetical protein
MTQLVFSRRALQQRLVDLESVLSESAHADIIKRLERPGESRLPAMWEVAWLHALSAVTSIGHEVPLPDGSRPDFSLLLDEDAHHVAVVGDITSVSDKGLHAENPVEAFFDAIVAIARKHKVNPDHLQYRIGDRQEGEYPDRRTVLMLPPRRELPAFLKQQVTPWIRQLAKTRPEQDFRHFLSESVQVSLGYNTRQEAAHGSHAVYNIPLSPRRNPLYTALSKKSRQLSGAPTDALRVLILCDAGCNALSQTPWASTSLSADQVIQKFLRTSRVLDAVLTVTTEPVERYALHDNRQRLKATWVARTTPRFEGAPRALAAMRQLLGNAIGKLPRAMLDPRNAYLRADQIGYGRGSMGVSVSDRKVRVSARLVLALLAGKLTYEEFSHIQGFDDPESVVGHPFKYAFDRGRMIEATRIESGGDADDDWIEFRFSQDPAISSFRRSAPKQGDGS